MAHTAECAACAAHAAEAKGFDDRIARALRIDVPAEGIASQRRRVGGRGRAVRRPWVAAAASLTLAVAVGAVLQFSKYDPRPDALGDAIVEHLREEPEAFGPGWTEPDAATLRRMLTDQGVRIGERAGAVLYVRLCIVDGMEVPHLVVESAAGPVTVMLFRDRFVRKAAPVQSARLSGRIVPAGGGSVAIVGHRQRPDAATEARILESVEWEA